MSVVFALQKLSHLVVFSQLLPRPLNKYLLQFHTPFLLLKQTFGRHLGFHWGISTAGLGTHSHKGFSRLWRVWVVRVWRPEDVALCGKVEPLP